MPNNVRVMVQVKSSLSLAATSFSPFAAAPSLNEMLSIGGTVEFDAGFSPVPLPVIDDNEGASRFGFSKSNAKLREQTYIVRASVSSEGLERFLAQSRDNTNILGVFADPVIQPIAVCPNFPIGTDRDVEDNVFLSELGKLGLNGAGVKVVIVDTGVNLNHLKTHGKSPGFDSSLSWGPKPGLFLGNMPVGHGTMCAYDVCIAAPACTLIDHALLTSSATGGSQMDGLLSDAVASYASLLAYMMKATEPFAGDEAPRTLVVNNSWGMFHPSWDFPVGQPGNYSDNAAHPFNIIVASLEAAGADILFAAGNCGTECPDGRCMGLTTGGIYGANSSPKVLSVAGVSVKGERLGYSTKGPGRLDADKPDISSFTHFAGSGVYTADGGTSAATPVLTGVVAAIRRLYPASILPPALLRDFIRKTATPKGTKAEYGHGIINVPELLKALHAWKSSL